MGGRKYFHCFLRQSSDSLRSIRSFFSLLTRWKLSGTTLTATPLLDLPYRVLTATFFQHLSYFHVQMLLLHKNIYSNVPPIFAMDISSKINPSSNSLRNSHPISNILFMSKVLWKGYLSHLLSHLYENNLFSLFQSVYHL